MGSDEWSESDILERDEQVRIYVIDHLTSQATPLFVTEKDYFTEVALMLYSGARTTPIATTS